MKRNYAGGPALAAWMQTQRGRRDLSREDVAVNAGVSMGTIIRAEQGKKILRANEQAIRRALDSKLKKGGRSR